MGHLTIESLARMVSEAPYPEEKDHLDSCMTCQAELRALREQTEAMWAPRLSGRTSKRRCASVSGSSAAPAAPPTLSTRPTLKWAIAVSAPAPG